MAVTRRAPPFREVSDGAILEIYALEALRGSLLVGPYSRFGWHHPGPLYFYLLAPWYWASGLHTAGMQAGALVINLAAVWLIVRTMAAAGTTRMTTTVSVVLVWYALRSGDLLVSAWNPHIIVLPLIAYVVLAAALAASPTRPRLLALVFIGSFLAQTHLAMVPIAAGVGILAAWSCRQLSRSSWAMVLILVLLLWAPPLIEQLTHRPGNLASILRFFLGNRGGQDFAVAIQAWASALTAAFRPGFSLALGADYVPDVGWFPSLLAAGLIGSLALLVVKSGRSSRAEAWLLRMCLVASVAALLETARIQDHIIDHEIYWVSGIGVLSVAAIVGYAIPFTAREADAPKSRFALVTATAAWLIVAALGADGMRGVLNRRRTLDDHAVDVLTDQIRSYLESAHARRPLFEISPPVWPIAAGALLELDKAGVRFAVGDRWRPMFGERFAPSGDEDGTAMISGSAVATVVTPIR